MPDFAGPESGMSPTLLLIHGWGFGPGVWDGLRTALPEVQAVAVDFGYFGTSAEPVPAGPVIVVAHSTGAMIALRQPPHQCLALVAINGFDRFVSGDDAPGVAPRLLDRMIARLPHDPVGTVADFRRRCGDSSSFGEPHGGRLGAHLDLLRDADERQAAAEWRKPLLHLSGARDPILPASLRASAFERAPFRSTAEHPEGGHLLPVSHPAWCADHIRGLVRAL